MKGKELEKKIKITIENESNFKRKQFHICKQPHAQHYCCEIRIVADKTRLDFSQLHGIKYLVLPLFFILSL